MVKESSLMATVDMVRRAFAEFLSLPTIHDMRLLERDGSRRTPD